MVLSQADWWIIASFFLLSVIIGIISSRRAGKSYKEFFLSGRNMPWWLLGVSMVATTFSCDTPNLVTDIVRQNGVSGNWVWWAFLLTGMLTVFIYARLWRKSGILTDLEFYEIRYSGKMAAFVRGFRAIYLGFVFNILIMALVSLALIKIGAVMLNWPPAQTLIIAMIITVIYSTLGGLRGIILTDLFQFIIAMVGSIGAAIILVNLPEVGGMESLLSHENVISKIDIFPDFANRDSLLVLFILPLAVQWWSVWYPGSEPGGGGYVVQRMLSAKNERGALKATLLFNVAHYALRPWPWIIVALTSLVVFPDIASLQATFPGADPQIIKNDFAYPAMLSLLPKGFLGIVVASLIAAFMSTISTHLNWGSSYLVHDFYKRFIDKQASEKKMVFIGRIFTVLLMFFATLFALMLENALQAFQIVLQIGAGTGLIFILRWFWWRINAYSEVTAMIVSFLVALYFQFIHPITGFAYPAAGMELLIGIGITTIAWIGVTYATSPASMDTLIAFYKLVQPGGSGWRKVIHIAETEKTFDLKGVKEKWNVPYGILAMFFGTISIFSVLFAIGNFIYGEVMVGAILSVSALLTCLLMLKFWK